MIVEPRTLLNLSKIIVKAAGNSQHDTFASRVMLDQLCLKMILEHRTLLNLTKILVKTAGNSQHGTFAPSAVLDQKTKKLTILRSRNYV